MRLPVSLFDYPVLDGLIERICRQDTADAVFGNPILSERFLSEYGTREKYPFPLEDPDLGFVG